MEKNDRWVFVARKVAFWAAARRPYCSECLGDALAIALVFLDGVEPDTKIVEAFEGLTF